MKHSAWQTVMGILLLCIVALISWQAGTLVAVHNQAAEADKARPVVVIDAGHGGSDPGKVGINGQLEKDINLKITEQLKAYLEASDVEVILTRDSDQGLYSSGDSHKKMADMRKRCEIINEAVPDLVVSIHQNSLPSSKRTHGAQVFYGKKEGSAEVANAVQLALNQTVNAGNEKTEKAIDASIFLMKNVTAPAILIECGFLSNENETALLKSGEYQQRLAVVIASGLLQQ